MEFDFRGLFIAIAIAGSAAGIALIKAIEFIAVHLHWK